MNVSMAQGSGQIQGTPWDDKTISPKHIRMKPRDVSISTPLLRKSETFFGADNWAPA
jgi:hypothetical protein